MHQSDWCIFFDFMTINKLIRFIENWAPPQIAWERDNVGLQIGSRDCTIRNVLLALDLTDKVVDTALENDCNFIFTHHPFLFNPINNIDFTHNPKASIIRKIISNNINIFAAHTNLDFTKDGVSFQLAKRIGLGNIDFLSHLSGKLLKLVVFLPAEKKEAVANALFNAGAGKIGEYENCSFSSEGVGTFKGSEDSNPVVGEKGRLEKVNEVRIEVVVDSWKLNKVIASLIKSHPYEEPAFDIYPVNNLNGNYGAGAIGEFKNAIGKNEFLKIVARKLKVTALRYSNGNGGRIKRVAVCGGTCSDMLNEAINKGADAFITADVKYHSFQDADGKILFVDAGHYETENVVLDEVKRRMEKFFSDEGEKVKILKFKGITNPVKVFINK